MDYVVQLLLTYCFLRLGSCFEIIPLLAQKKKKVNQSKQT